MNRRTWTQDQKIEIVNEANEHGVSMAARRHGLTSSQVFSWRKELGQSPIEGEQSLLDMVHSQITVPLIRKLKHAISDDKINPKTAASTFALLVGTIEKLNALREVEEKKARQRQRMEECSANVTADFQPTGSKKLNELSQACEIRKASLRAKIDNDQCPPLSPQKIKLVEMGLRLLGSAPEEEEELEAV